ncbi:MFS transporter, partial [Spirochaetota bacterium]
WRKAFFIVGLPGVIMALLVKFTIKEPPRGLSDNIAQKVENLPFMDTVRYLFSLKSFRHLCAATSIAAFSGYAIMSWSPVFLKRVFEMDKSQSGPILGIAIGIVGGLSTLIGGLLSDKLSTKKSRKWAMYVSAIGVLGMIPFILVFLLTTNKTLALVGFNLMFLVGLFYSAPSFATVQGLARPDMRALASAIFLLLINLIGTGCGPWFAGIISTLLEPTYGSTESLRYSLIIISAGILWSAVHYILAARTLPEDLDKAVTTD